MKDFSLFIIPNFVMEEGFTRWLHKKRKIDTNLRDNRPGQKPAKYIVATEARWILELIRTEQKMITEAEKRHEIERLMQAIRGCGKL